MKINIKITHKVILMIYHNRPVYDKFIDIYYHNHKKNFFIIHYMYFLLISEVLSIESDMRFVSDMKNEIHISYHIFL